MSLAFARKWMARLPRPLTDEDRAAGYDISVLQAEFSLTQILDRRVRRVFFEQVIRDNLDAGRPDEVSLIFDRTVRTRGKHPKNLELETRRTGVSVFGVHPRITRIGLSEAARAGQRGPTRPRPRCTPGSARRSQTAAAPIPPGRPGWSCASPPAMPTSCPGGISPSPTTSTHCWPASTMSGVTICTSFVGELRQLSGI